MLELVVTVGVQIIEGNPVTASVTTEIVAVCRLGESSMLPLVPFVEVVEELTPVPLFEERAFQLTTSVIEPPLLLPLTMLPPLLAEEVVLLNLLGRAIGVVPMVLVEVPPTPPPVPSSLENTPEKEMKRY